MKISRVEANNYRRVFEVRTPRGVLPFPYVLADPAPSPEDRLVEVYVDPELGREAFTYRLESGAEGAVHVESVLEYNQDPRHMADLFLYRLTIEAQRRMDETDLSTREIARRLRTSLSQLNRLLDPTNYKKSLHQMLALLFVLGCDVDLVVKERARRPA